MMSPKSLKVKSYLATNFGVICIFPHISEIKEAKLTYTKYPNSIDTSTELPKATDNITPVMAEVVNRLREAIIAIENELGINPSSTYGTVRDRLDAISDGYSDGYTVVVSDGYTVIIDGYNVIIDGYTTLDIYSDGYILASKNALNFSGGGVSTTYDSVNDRINIEISGGGTVDFAAVKAALALADSSIDFANQQLTSIAAPVLPSDGARLQDVLDAIATSEAYTDSAIAGINGGITELTQDVLAGDGYGSQAATVVGIQGNPVDSSAPSINDILTWDGTKWSPAAAPINAITQLTQDVEAGDGYGSQIATVVGLYGNPLSNTTPNSGEVLAWNGSIWIPTATSSGGLQALVDIDFTAETPVDIKAGGDGTYTLGGVDFTIVNTSSANKWDVTNAQGMCIQPAATFNAWPAFYTQLLTLAPSCDLMTQNTFFVMHVKRGAIGAGGTYDQWILSGLTHDAVWNTTGGIPTTYAALANGYLSGNFIQSFGVVGFGTILSSSAFTDDWNNTVQMLSMVSGGQMPQWSMQAYSSFPGTQTATRRFSGEQPVQDAAYVWSQAQSRFFCEIVAGGSSNIGVEFEIHRLAVYGR